MKALVLMYCSVLGKAGTWAPDVSISILTKGLIKLLNMQHAVHPEETNVIKKPGLSCPYIPLKPHKNTFFSQTH